MPPEIMILIAQALLKEGPALARELRDIFTKPNPTPADWDKVFDAAENKAYADYTKPKN